MIERRGTGGGNFRLMYSRFLAEAGREEAELCREVAGAWTGLAEALHAASESDVAEPAHWHRIAGEAGTVLDGEERLWHTLAGE